MDNGDRCPSLPHIGGQRVRCSRGPTHLAAPRLRLASPLPEGAKPRGGTDDMLAVLSTPTASVWSIGRVVSWINPGRPGHLASRRLARSSTPAGGIGNTGLTRQLIAGSEVATEAPHMATCGRPRKSDGRPCERPVRRPGMACKDHGGPGALQRTPKPPAMPRTSRSSWPSSAAGRPSWERAASSPSAPVSSWQPPPEPPPVRPARPPRLRAKERERVKEAAEFCADVLADGSWEQEVADRLTDQAGGAWERLKRNRRRRNCRKLAQMARTILKAQDQIHQLAGELASQAARVAGVRGAALDFTRELVKRIPIGPVDAKLTAAARAIQIAGIALCLMDRRNLAQCDCFIDLALAETKERVSQILETRLANWVELARLGPAPSTAGPSVG